MRARREFGVLQWVGVVAVVLVFVWFSPVGIVDVPRSPGSTGSTTGLRTWLYVAVTLPLLAAAGFGVASMIDKDGPRARRWGWWCLGLLIAAVGVRLLTNAVWGWLA